MPRSEQAYRVIFHLRTTLLGRTSANCRRFIGERPVGLVVGIQGDFQDIMEYFRVKEAERHCSVAISNFFLIEVD